MRSQIRLALAMFPKTGEYLTPKQLVRFEDILSQLDLDKEEKEFFDTSKKIRKEEEEAELQKEKERNTILTEQRNKADTQARKAYKVSIVAVIAFVLACIVAGIAWYLFKKADAATKAQKLATDRAEKSIKDFQKTEFNAYLIDAKTF